MTLVANKKLTEQGNNVKQVFDSLNEEKEMEDFLVRLYEKFGMDSVNEFFKTIAVH